MPAPYMQPTMSMLELREELVYSRIACNSEPLAKPLARVFTALLDEWKTVFFQQLDHWDAQTDAEFQVWRTDDVLDERVDDVNRILLNHTDGDREHPKYELYFATRPYDLKRPVLGEELESVRAWLPLLEGEDVGPLAKLKKPIEQAIEHADAAVAASTAADAENERFRRDGALAQFVERVRQKRDEVYAELEATRVADPKHKLPRDWSAGFFRRSSRTVSDEERTARSTARDEEKKRQAELAEKKKAAREKLRAAQRELAALSKG